MTRRVLISGASGDIGRSLIELLLAEDRDVRIAACYFSADVVSFGWPSNVIPLQADLRDPQAAATLTNEAAKALGGIDAFVQLAGDAQRATHWSDLTHQQWTNDANLNLVSTFAMTQAALPHLRKSEAGRIVLMSSAFASRGHGAGSIAYAVAKQGVETLTRILARDLASAGILVNCVAPGFVLDHFSTVRSQRSPEQVASRMASIPLGYAGTPHDVSREIAHLIATENRFVTGQVIAIDGGEFI